MLVIKVEINGNEVIYLKAVRIDPMNRTPTKDEMCTYNFYVGGEVMTTIDYPYGSVAGLSIEMLKIYEKVQEL